MKEAHGGRQQIASLLGLTQTVSQSALKCNIDYSFDSLKHTLQAMSNSPRESSTTLCAIPCSDQKSPGESKFKAKQGHGILAVLPETLAAPNQIQERVLVA